MSKEYKLTDNLKTYLKQMSELTKDKCGQCRAPYSCCSPEYGEFVIDEFPEESKAFKTGNNQKCRFLIDSTGCSVPPEYRLLCTIHICEQHYSGGNYNTEFYKKYFKLRDNISEEMDMHINYVSIRYAQKEWKS